MATKAQLIAFIVERFTEANGNDVSKSKLDAYKKADLEQFIKAEGLEEDLKKWLEAA